MSDYTGDGIDPQGFLGSLLGKVAGRLIGGALRVANGLEDAPLVDAHSLKPVREIGGGPRRAASDRRIVCMKHPEAQPIFS